MYSIIPCPKTVKASIAGILAIVEIKTNLVELTGSSPPT